MQALNRLLIALIFILGTLQFFWRLNDEPLAVWDEQTNQNVILNTINSGQSITLSLNGKPFLEKPPLWYWLEIPLIQLIGNHNYVYRLVSVVSGIGILLLTYYVVSSRSSRVRGLLAVIILLLIPHLFSMNPANLFSSHTLRSADLDALQIVLILASYVLLLAKNKSTKILLLSYLLLGLAFLTKGPLAIIITLLNSWFAFRQGYKLKQILLGWLIMILTILPWIAIMQLNFPSEFGQSFIDYHILSRALTALEGHSEPWYFYISIFINPLVNPFGLPFLFVLIHKLVKRYRLDDYQLYALVFVLMILLLFSLAQTKLAWYLLPLYPFLAIFLASYKYKSLKLP